MTQSSAPARTKSLFIRILPACLLSICFVGPPSQIDAFAAVEQPHVVSSTADLMKALSKAHPGARILLAAGNYGHIDLKGVKFTTPVTLASADPLRPAVLEGLGISDSAGLRFERITIEAAPKGTGVGAVDSSNLTFEGLNVHGTALRNSLGFMVRNASGVSIKDCDISQLWAGINHLDATDLTISGNKLHDLEEDAIRGGGSSNVVVANNFVTDLHPVDGDHPDAIQFWSTSAHPSAHDISITGNVYLRGAGAPAQGIFVADGGYQNLTVSNNAIVGGLYQGILVSEANGAVIQGNLVEGYTDQGSWIAIATSKNVQVSGNQATGLMQLNHNDNYTEKGNTALHPGKVGDTVLLTSWKQTHLGDSR